MNILIDLRPLMHAKLSGVTVYMSNMCQELVRIDRKNHYYFFCNSWHDIEIDRPNWRKFKIIRTKIPNLLLNLSMSLLRWPKIDKIVAKKIGKQIDVCFFMDPRPAPVSKKSRKVVTFHDLSLERYPKNFSWKTRLWHLFLRPRKEAEEADQIIAVSQFTKKELEEAYKIDPAKINVIYHGIGRRFQVIKNQDILTQVREKYQLSERFVLSVATIEPRKNLQNIIRAVESYNVKNPDQPYQLVIVGRKNPEIFRDPGLAEKDFVRFLALVPSSDKVALYNLASAYMGMSFYEGFGFPIMEAMKCGCPVVAANSTSICELANEYAYLADPYDINDITKALEFALLRGREADLIEKALAYVRKLTWRRAGLKSIKVLDRAVN